MEQPVVLLQDHQLVQAKTKTRIICFGDEQVTKINGLDSFMLALLERGISETTFQRMHNKATLSHISKLQIVG